MNLKSRIKILVSLVLLGAVFLTQCKGRDDSYQNTTMDHAIAFTKVLKLNNEQMRQLVDILNDTKRMTARDRSKHKGDNEALLKAAKVRSASKVSRIEAFLTEDQKIKFKEMRDNKNITPKAIIFAERLGLDCRGLEAIAKIVAGSPTAEEAAAVKASKDPEKIKAFAERTGKIHQGIESLLRSNEQKAEFKKMIQDQMKKVEQILEKG